MATLRSGARVTASEVKEIFDTDLSDSALHAHINYASKIVDQIEAEAPSTDDETLELIELYWSAEVATTQDPRAEREQLKTSNVTYDIRTTYGEMAIDLDPTGTLASTTKGKATLDVPNAKNLQHDYVRDEYDRYS